MKVTKKRVTEITETLLANNMIAFDWKEAAKVHDVVRLALEKYEENREEPEVYMATIEEDGCEWEFAGLYSGRYNDVVARVRGDAVLELVVIEEVPAGYEAHKKNLIAKRDRLQAELLEIEGRLASGRLEK